MAKSFKDVTFLMMSVEILYTKRNVELRLQDFQAMLRQEDISPENSKYAGAVYNN